MLIETFRELFLFSPDQQTVDTIKKISGKILEDYAFIPVFYDIARTGRQLWISIYFRVAADAVSVKNIQEANERLSSRLAEDFPNAACEIILDNHNTIST